MPRSKETGIVRNVEKYLALNPQSQLRTYESNRFTLVIPDELLGGIVRFGSTSFPIAHIGAELLAMLFEAGKEGVTFEQIREKIPLSKRGLPLQTHDMFRYAKEVNRTFLQAGVSKPGSPLVGIQFNLQHIYKFNTWVYEKPAK